MDEWRLICSEPASGAYNMALDEAIFDIRSRDGSIPSTLRFFKWSTPQYTIGYFQKFAQFEPHKLPVTRRLTGGLGVRHDQDLSYSLVTGDNETPFSSDQEANYLTLHKILKAGLMELGISSDFVQHASRISDLTANDDRISCIKTLFPHDLFRLGKKIAGTSQRKRGDTILLQGTIHLSLKDKTENELTNAFIYGFKKELGRNLRCGSLSDLELSACKELMAGKYSKDYWNKKF
jgi:lipoyl(octanoyl) transferase